MKRLRGHSKKLLARLLIAILTFSIITTLTSCKEDAEKFSNTDFNDYTIEYGGKEYSPKSNVETFLVLGLDKFEDSSADISYNNDKQADFLLLFVLDNNSKKCTAVHINRDTMADMNILGVAGQKIDTVKKQIALAHTYGDGDKTSCRNTADAVSGILHGIKIDHYISLTLDSVAVLNDLAGGVEVTVLDDFTGIDDTLKKGQTVTLFGEHALRYVRTRYGLDDSSNNTRMARQKQYLNALYAKVKKLIEQDEEFIVDTSLKMSDYIVSDRSVNRLQELAQKITTYEFCGIKDIEGKTIMGEKYVEFYPDENSTRKLVISLLYQPKK